MQDSKPVRISNEYASVEVEAVIQDRGSMLKITDLSTSKTFYLDPLELQALAWATHKDMYIFARPFFKERAQDHFMAKVARGEAVLAAESILRQMAEPE